MDWYQLQNEWNSNISQVSAQSVEMEELKIRVSNLESNLALMSWVLSETNTASVLLDLVLIRNRTSKHTYCIVLVSEVESYLDEVYRDSHNVDQNSKYIFGSASRWDLEVVPVSKLIPFVRASNGQETK